jgi:hypothetical protein
MTAAKQIQWVSVEDYLASKRVSEVNFFVASFI